MYLASGAEGSVYAWIVCLMPLFLMIAGLVTDLSTMYSLVSRVQATLDAAGTSAISSSLLETSIMDGQNDPAIDPEKARQNFFWLVKRNLRLKDDLQPQPESFLEGGLQFTQMEIQAEGPPSVTITARVPFKATLLGFILPEFSLPVHSQSVLETTN
ncbi:MAG TPA: Tad domain-containing protein [Bacillota bacterium]|nr:Tad domain-containing protein [Bacillota bacterium]